MAVRDHFPVGFDVIDSPFRFLRDSSTYYYHNQPNVCFGDVSSGYIYLEPRERFEKCKWAEGFITLEMLAKYEPYYEGRAGKKFSNAKEVNEYYIDELIIGD